MKPKFGSTGIIIAIFAVLIGVGIFFSIGDSEGSSSGSDIFSQSFGSSGIGSGFSNGISLSDIFGVLFTVAFIVWLIHLSKGTDRFPSKEDTPDVTLSRNIFNFFRSNSPKAIAKREVRDLKYKRKKLKKNLKKVRKAREKAIKKIGKVGTTGETNKGSLLRRQTLGRGKSILDERRRDYSRRLIEQWKIEFGIERIGTEDFPAYSQRVIDHLEIELKMIEELLDIEKIAAETIVEETVDEAQQTSLLYRAGETIEDMAMLESKISNKDSSANIYLQQVKAESNDIKTQISDLLKSIARIRQNNIEKFSDKLNEIVEIEILANKLNNSLLTPPIEELKTDLEEMGKMLVTITSQFDSIRKQYEAVEKQLAAVNADSQVSQFNVLIQEDAEGNPQALIPYLENMKSVLLDLKRTIRQSESESSSILTRIATDMDAIRKQIPIIVPIPNSNLESVVANTSVVNSNQEAKATITEKERQLLEKFNELHTLFFHIITLKSTTAVSAIKNIKVLGNTVNDTLDSKNINVAKLKSEINQLLNDRNLENTLQIITQIQITLSQIREDTTQAYEHWKTRHLTEAHTKRVESGNLNKTQGDYYIKLLNLVDEMLKLDSAIRGEVSGNVAGERSNVSSQPSATA